MGWGVEPRMKGLNWKTAETAPHSPVVGLAPFLGCPWVSLGKGTGGPGSKNLRLFTWL